MLTAYKKLMDEEADTQGKIKAAKAEMDNISHRLTQRIKELAERYETPLPTPTNGVETLTAKEEEHLKTIGFKIDTL